MILLLRKSQSIRLLGILTGSLFLLTGLQSIPLAMAQTQLSLPLPGTRVNLSAGYAPLMLRGVMVHPENPFRFDFIVDTGDSTLRADALEQESTQMIRYFLVALTVPEDEQWVNLSPYEKDRIIPGSFGVTDMGRDLLAQDYFLKQVTASLIYPEEDLGKRFWDRVYQRAQRLYGTTDIPVNTFNKVWIVPDSATVYENGAAAFVTQSRLKIMLEEDYLALDENEGNRSIGLDQFVKNDDVKKVNDVSAAIVREIVIPELEKEVNEGENFAKLRQIYHAMILATWFKENLRDHVLGQQYVNQNKVLGVEIEDKAAKEQIYHQYLEAYKLGAYNYIKEEYDPVTQEIIPKKYFSGGAIFGRAVNQATDYARLTGQNISAIVAPSFLGTKLAVNVLLANPQKRVDIEREALRNLPVFVSAEDLAVATVDTDNEAARYPILTLLDGSRVINKTRQNRRPTDALSEALFSRLNFEVSQQVGFNEINPVQVLVTPQGFSSLEGAWGLGLEDALSELGLDARTVREALDFRLTGQTAAYGQLVEIFGEDFVMGDIYRLLTGDPFDSILAENIRYRAPMQEGAKAQLRWVDYGDSFGYLDETELDRLLDYLVERAQYIRSSLAERLIQRIVEITEDDLQVIADRVVGDQTEGAYSSLTPEQQTLARTTRERVRENFIESFRQRQNVLLELQILMEQAPISVAVEASATAVRDAAVLSDAMRTDSTVVRQGMEDLNRLLERLPSDLQEEVASDLNMIKIFSGVSAEVGFTQSQFQFLIGRLGEVERTTLIAAIQADENFTVIQPKAGVFSVINKRAAREVIAANADVFPAEAQTKPNWVVNEFAQWLNAEGPEWEIRTVRYGLMSGYPRSAAEEFVRFDRTLRKFKEIFANQEEMIEYLAKKDIPENAKAAGREHFQSVLLGYDVSNEEIDLLIDTSTVGTRFQMLAFRPAHREWVNQVETLLAEGEEYLSELRPSDIAVPLSGGATAVGSRRDAAVLPESSQNVGGIDLNPENLNLLRQGNRIEFDLNPIGFESIEIPGLTPVIFQITPVTNLPLLLGQLDVPQGQPNPAELISLL